MIRFLWSLDRADVSELGCQPQLTYSITAAFPINGCFILLMTNASSCWKMSLSLLPPVSIQYAAHITIRLLLWPVQAAFFFGLDQTLGMFMSITDTRAWSSHTEGQTFLWRAASAMNRIGVSMCLPFSTLSCFFHWHCSLFVHRKPKSTLDLCVCENGFVLHL